MFWFTGAKIPRPRSQKKCVKAFHVFAAIFFVCWFAISYILIDVVLKFQTLLDYFGSFALLETTLWLWVLVPTLAVYMLTKDEDNIMDANVLFGVFIGHGYKTGIDILENNLNNGIYYVGLQSEATSNKCLIYDEDDFGVT